MSTLPRTYHRVVSNDVELKVVEVGDPAAPPLLLVHGFPDTHELYAPLLDDLGRDFHVATFDLRGVGGSSAPKSRAGYRIANVLPDLSAVIDRVFGQDASVHVLAHDWGSVIAFSYASEPATRKRVRSFTSISGPHLGMMLADNFKNLGSGKRRQMLLAAGQLLSSWYVFAFQLPVLPELLMRRFGEWFHRVALSRGGVPYHDPYLHVSNQEFFARVKNSIELYRQNLLHPPKPPAKGSMDVPLALIVPLRDPFVRPQSYQFIHDYATDLTVYKVDASHWMPRSHPHEIARILRALAYRVDGTTPRVELEKTA